MSDSSGVTLGMAPMVGRSVDHSGPDLNISTALGWIGMNFGTHIHVPLWSKRDDFVSM